MGLHQVLCVYKVEVDVSLTLDCSWDSFPPTRVPCPASIRGLLCCLIVSCFVLSSYLRLLETYSSLKRKKKGSCAGIKERWRGARS